MNANRTTKAAVRTDAQCAAHTQMINHMLASFPAKSVRGLSPAQRRHMAEHFLLLAAYHAAGHVAVGFYLGVSKASFVTISEGSKASSTRRGELTNLGVEETIMYILAGHAADSRFRGALFKIADVINTLDAPDVDLKDSSALSKALLLAMKAANNDTANAIELVCQCADQVNDIVVLPEVWPKIQQFAQCLLDFGTVDAASGLIMSLFGPIWNAGKVRHFADGWSVVHGADEVSGSLRDSVGPGEARAVGAGELRSEVPVCGPEIEVGGPVQDAGEGAHGL